MQNRKTSLDRLKYETLNAIESDQHGILDEIDSIIAEKMQKEDHDNEFDKLIGYSQAELNLLKINEYIGKILDMGDELKQNTKEKN